MGEVTGRVTAPGGHRELVLLRRLLTGELSRELGRLEEGVALRPREDL